MQSKNLISLLDIIDIPAVCNRCTVFAESELRCYHAVFLADPLMKRHHCAKDDVYHMVGAYLKWAPVRYKKLKVSSDG